jgi:WD40 repeat protein
VAGRAGWCRRRSNDGKRCHGGSGPTARIWDAETGGSVAIGLGAGADFGVEAVAFSQTERFGTARGAEIWDARLGLPVASFEHAAWCVAFAEAATSASREDGPAKVWDRAPAVAPRWRGIAPVSRCHLQLMPRVFSRAGIGHFCRGTFRLSGREWLALVGPRRMSLVYFYSPDGTRSLPASDELFHPGRRVGRRTAQYRSHRRGAEVAFSPGGARGKLSRDRMTRLGRGTGADLLVLKGSSGDRPVAPRSARTASMAGHLVAPPWWNARTERDSRLRRRPNPASHSIPMKRRPGWTTAKVRMRLGKDS